MLQRKNMQESDNHSIILLAVSGEANDNKKQLRILPPSKLSAGKRLINANKNDDKINKIISFFGDPSAPCKNENEETAEMILNNGPAAASIASFL